MDKKQKEETIEVFAEAFHEVVVPVLENLKKELKEDIHKLDDKVEGINRRLIQVTDHHAEKLDNLSHHQADHEKRIKKLEIRRTVTL